MRIFAIAIAALAIGACNPSATGAKDQSTAAPSDAATGSLQPRINLGQVDPARAKAVMHERHEGMEQIGKANKLLRRELGGNAPDMAAVKGAAASLNGLAQKASGWFPAGTGPETGKTGTKPDVWQKPQDFTAKLTAFQAASARLDAAARTGNAAASKSAFGDVGKSCKACHDAYRKDMH